MSNFLENIKFIPDVRSGGTYLVTGFPGRLLLPFFDIFSNDCLDDLSRVSKRIDDDFFVFRNGVGCAPGVYKREGGAINWEIVRSLYENENATIYLRAIQRYFPQVYDCLREVEREFPSARTFANLFLTPPFSIGLKPHLDPTEFFVLQLRGTKVWNFWRQPSFEDVKEKRVDERSKFALEIANAESKTAIIEIREGQVMYVPRFKIHGPESTHHESWHLTIGLAFESMKALYD